MKRFILAMIFLLLLGLIDMPSERRSTSPREVRNTGSANSLDFQVIAVMQEE